MSSRRQFLIDTGGALLGLSLVGCSEPKDPFIEGVIADWEKGIPQWLQETKMPAVSIAFIRNGRVAWKRAFGVKDAGTKAPVNDDTIFAACSNTKPVFAYAVLKLCEKGVLNLDTPLTKYTSERITADPRLDLITARHVLTHTTGFPNWRNGPNLEIEFTPGEKYQYSGEGFSYLQSVVVQVTKQPFVDFMQTNILKPFGMKSSGFTWTADGGRNTAMPHTESGQRIPGKYVSPSSEAESAEGLARYGAAASLWTTPADYAKFLLEILNPKPPDEFRLNADSHREMLRPQVKVGDNQSEALSWPILQMPEIPPYFAHGGQDAGYYCTAMACLERKSGMMVMTNGDNFQAFLAKLAPDPMDFLKRFFAA